MSEPTPVFSRREVVDFTPEGSERTYRIAPLTYLQRQQFQTDLTVNGGWGVSDQELMEGTRAALREMNPENLHELLAAVDAFEQLPTEESQLGADAPSIRATMVAIRAAVAGVPVYSRLLARRITANELRPWYAARHALRGWSGPGLPPFELVKGCVPDHLLELIPELELMQVGNRAFFLMYVGPSAAKNFEPPSSSPETPEPSPAV